MICQYSCQGCMVSRPPFPATLDRIRMLSRPLVASLKQCKYHVKDDAVPISESPAIPLCVTSVCRDSGPSRLELTPTYPTVARPGLAFLLKELDDGGCLPVGLKRDDATDWPSRASCPNPACRENAGCSGSPKALGR